MASGMRKDPDRGAWNIYGPDGNVMITGGSDAPMHRAYAQEVQKRVRSNAVSMTVAVDRARGRLKPTPVTFDTLRLMSQRNEWVRAIVNKRARQIRGKKWSIQVKDEDPSGAAGKLAKRVEKLLTHPQLHGSQVDTVHWHQFISTWLEDVLVLDRGCIEKERDGNGWIKALYVVDGATVQPNLDERGAYFHPDAYVQIVDGMVTAKFGVEDLSVTMDNPQSDVRLRGYGFSPLEALVVSVTADLHSAKYNADYFDKNAVPEGLLHLGEEIDPELVEGFRLYWANEIQGKPNAFPIMGGSKAPEWLQWRANNRDMQFMEYQQWLLQKMCAVYDISQKDLGQISDVNRSTAEDASGQQQETGVEPLQQLIKNMVDLEIVGELGLGLGDFVEFSWEDAGESADEINKKFQPMHDAGVASGSEWRDAHGMDPDGDPKATHGKEGLRMHLSTGEKKALPDQRDADLHGTAAEQDREDEVSDTEHARAQETAADDHDRQKDLAASDGEGGQPTAVPWKPANGDDKDVKDAMAAHDEESGIGPRNVRKTAPGGHDRHPAMTHAADDLEHVFEKATHRLVDGLTALLGTRR